MIYYMSCSTNRCVYSPDRAVLVGKQKIALEVFYRTVYIYHFSVCVCILNCQNLFLWEPQYNYFRKVHIRTTCSHDRMGNVSLVAEVSCLTDVSYFMTHTCYIDKRKMYLSAACSRFTFRCSLICDFYERSINCKVRGTVLVFVMMPIIMYCINMSTERLVA